MESSTFNITKNKKIVNEVAPEITVTAPRRVKASAELSKVFRNCIASSSAHGLPNIIEKNNRILSSLIWSVFYVISAGSSIWMIWSMIDTYLAYEVVTTMDVKHSSNVILPAVTLCSYNQNNMGYPDEYWNMENGGIRNGFIKQNDNFYRFEMDITETPGVMSMRKCIKINGGKNKYGNDTELLYSQDPGIAYGLSIEFDTNDITGLNQMFQIYIGENKIHPASSDFYISMNKDDQIVAALSKTISKKLGKPYNDCTENIYVKARANSTYYNPIEREGLDYQKQTCTQLCFVYHVSELCDCTFYGFLGTEEKNISCRDNSQEINQCVKNAIETNLKEVCNDECPLECDSTLITSSILTQPASENDSGSSLKVFYSSFRYTEIAEVPKTNIDSLVASIGGTMGLFLGLSLLSFVAIIDFILEIIYMITSRMK